MITPEFNTNLDQPHNNTPRPTRLGQIIGTTIALGLCALALSLITAGIVALWRYIL